jgi:hypothetical protein
MDSMIKQIGAIFNGIFISNIIELKPLFINVSAAILSYFLIQLFEKIKKKRKK